MSNRYTHFDTHGETSSSSGIETIQETILVSSNSLHRSSGAKANEYCCLKNLQFVFILSHMRSGSSVLTHILSTNPEILGFGEAHLSYSNYSHLKELVVRVSEIFELKTFVGRYVLDKILHNHEIGPDILSNPRIRFVFLIREPGATLQSLLNLHKFDPGNPWSSLETSQLYYQTRLLQLTRLAQEIGDRERALLFTYDELLDETQSVFKLIEDFLGLKVPLTEEYEVQPTTGKKGIGDPSPEIAKGFLARRHRTHAQQPTNLIDRKVVGTYEEAIERLKLCCRVV